MRPIPPPEIGRAVEAGDDRRDLASAMSSITDMSEVPVSTSMKCLFAVAVLAGCFEAVAAATPDSPGLGPRLAPGAFAVVLLACAWAMWARRSVAAATVAGVLLLIDVAGVPFYGRTSVTDWVLQGGFAVVGTVGIVAWVNVLRERPARLTATRG